MNWRSGPRDGKLGRVGGGAREKGEVRSGKRGWKRRICFGLLETVRTSRNERSQNRKSLFSYEIPPSTIRNPSPGSPITPFASFFSSRPASTRKKEKSGSRLIGFQIFAFFPYFSPALIINFLMFINRFAGQLDAEFLEHFDVHVGEHDGSVNLTAFQFWELL